MKRRDFMQVLGTGLLSTMIMPGAIGRVLVQQVSGRVPEPFNFDSEACCKLMAIGIGETTASSIAILSKDAPYVSCHQVIFDPTGKGTDLGDLLTRLRTTDLLFLLSAFDDVACRPIFEALGTAAGESDVLTVGIVSYRDGLLPDPRSVSSMWPVSRLSLPPFPQHAHNITDDLSGWDRYAMRHLLVTVADIIQRYSLICIDFADVKSIMTSGAQGSMGVGVAPIGSAQIAAIGALDRLTGQGFRITEESTLLACVRGSSAMTMDDFDDAAKVLYETFPSDSNVIASIVMDETMGGYIKVTILGNGNAHESSKTERALPAPVAAVPLRCQPDATFT